MTKQQKIEWAKRAFIEIAEDCEDLASLEIVTKAEAQTWKSIARKARHNAKMLD